MCYQGGGGGTGDGDLESPSAAARSSAAKAWSCWRSSSEIAEPETKFEFVDVILNLACKKQLSLKIDPT